MSGLGEGVLMTSSKFSKFSDQAGNWYGDKFQYVYYENTDFQ